jgi:hypothetical protein
MSTQVLLGFTAKRIVCQNTYAMAVRDLSQQVVLRHTKSIEGRLHTVQEILEGQLVYFRELEVKANWLADQRFNDIQFELAMRKVLGVDASLPVTDIATRTKGTMDILRSNFVSGQGIDASNRGSAWAAYNSFSEFSNHQKPVNNALERGGESSVRFESVLLGQGAAFNSKALQAIEGVLTT